MAFKFVALFALISAASAGYVAAPAYAQGSYAVSAPAYAHGSYAVAAPAYAQRSYAVAAPAYAQGTYAVAAPAYAQGSYAVAAPAYVKTVAAAPALVKTVQYEAPAQYDFSYGVSDSLTGDHKSQSESRQGDNVHGSYSLIDSDGYKRTVDYTADEHNGFNAVVRREPLGHAVAAPVAKVVSPVAQYAPATYTAQYAPAAYTAQYAPVAKVAYQAAPVAYAAAPVAKLVSQAHYAPQLVAGAYAAPAAHLYHH